MTQHNTFHTTLRVNITALPPEAAPAGTKTTRKAWPENKLAEAELEFTDGLLDGHVMRGFVIWRRADGSFFTSGPSRQWDDKGEKKYFNFLQSKNPLRREFLSDFIIAELQAVWANRIERDYPAGELGDETAAEGVAASA